MASLGEHYLQTSLEVLRKKKDLAEGAMRQLEPGDFHWQPDPESNSVAIIVKHLRGNMLSRWTDFLTSDGEKASRDRDGEFVEENLPAETLMTMWEEGWQRLFSTLESLTPDDLQKTVTIRGEPHTVLEAITRQLAHYSEHVGQIIYIAKHLRSQDWQTLSIARGQSKTYQPPT